MKYKNLSLTALKSLPDHELRMDRSNYNAYLGLPEIHTKEMPIEAVKEELRIINAQIVRNNVTSKFRQYDKLNNHSNGVN